ncbi:C45 family autoproteolytic acyltransferase/hydrolase [Halosolutus amylolyticus]|uniref:C45 family autoproteolytic acyltransferase/hydrolase n=1 Tax=Halosolutus amylolyticus TaxID=2932267 RepID=A0ABD5PKU0_9EURY|nr:C45 family peptidase [Halosolutus amylolyticus]
MDASDVDASPDSNGEPIPAVESFAAQARRRAEAEREVVEWAIDELESLIAARDVDLEPLLEYAEESQSSLPDRHRRAYETMADAFDVDRDLYAVYALAYSDLCEELAEGDGRSERHPNGCTNALVSPAAADATGSLVLKNRDIAGRGTRPKSIVEQPPIDDYYGFLTVDTCGTVMVFKGVNDRGLVAANTYIDANREDLDPGEQLRNGTAIRRLLEECTSVEEARSLLESYPTRRLMAQTLFLADGTDAALLEVDPAAERIAVDDDRVVVRTNHFVDGASTVTESSKRRRDRARALLAGESGDRLDRDDLWAVAADHANGPGDDSICRHPEPETDDPHAFGQLTTASAAVFEGGSPEIEVVMGNPCERDRTRVSFGEAVPPAFRTGRQWLDRVRAT